MKKQIFPLIDHGIDIIGDEWDEENESEEIKYLKTTLLLEPDNEEALYMLIDIELKKSNFSKVRDLTKNFKIICSTLCDKIQNINERLKNIEAKNEPKQ